MAHGVPGGQISTMKGLSLCSAPVPCLPFLSPSISPLTIHRAQGDAPQVWIGLGQLRDVGCHLGMSGETKQTEWRYGCRRGTEMRVRVRIKVKILSSAVQQGSLMPVVPRDPHLSPRSS